MPETVVSDDQVKTFFSKFGHIVDAKVMTVKTGEVDPVGEPILKGTGKGFIIFATQIAATLATQAKPEQLAWDGNVLTVNFYKKKEDI